jgi:hypothetical protein
LSPVMWNDTTGTYGVFNERVCPGCAAEDTLVDTGCGAPGCPGYSCPECGWGCSIDTPGGPCQAALDAEDDTEREERFQRERSAFGLSALTFTDPEETGNG